MSAESPPDPEKETDRGDANQPGRQKQSSLLSTKVDPIAVKLGAAIDRLSAIEKYLLELVNEDAIKYALLILAASRCRTAKDAIKSHLEPDPPLPRREQWWDR
jgi:hypothetical protein